MSNCIAPSSTTAITSDNKERRMFSPVVLFHDHRFMRDGDLEHVHIPYKDPHLIESHKERVYQMLQDNGRFWADVMTACTKEKPLSPVPSLVSSSPPSPRWSSSSSPPPRYSSRQRRGTFSSPTSTTKFSLVGPPSRRISKPSSTSVAATAAAAAAANHPHNQQSSNIAIGVSSSGGGSGKKRQRSNLPKPVTSILKTWLAEHKKHPYPNEDEKCQLVRQTGLARNQISNWFINARRRILRPMLMEEGDEDDEDDDEDYVKWRPAATSSSRRGVNLT